MNSWANKFNNKWFVRVDQFGIPVYGSLISRPIKPRNGRFIEVIIPNQICCVTPPIEILVTGTFEEGGSISVTISNTLGQISTYTSLNDTTASDSISNLATALEANLPGFGSWSLNDAETGIILTNPFYDNLTITAVFLAAPVP